MSIACTVTFGISPAVRIALSAYAALNAALAFGMATAWLGEFHLSPFLLCVHGCSAIACVVCAAQRSMARQIDVSGLGAITVTVQHWLRQSPGAGPVPVRLLPGSVFLPGMLVLKLADEQGSEAVFVVLPDAIRGGEFRRFAAALRTIAARDEGYRNRTFELIAGGQAQTQ